MLFNTEDSRVVGQEEVEKDEGIRGEWLGLKHTDS